MIDAAHLEAVRTWAAKTIEATVSPEAYGDWCYVCGSSPTVETFVVRHSVEPLITTDEFACTRCIARVQAASKEIAQ